MWRSWKYGLFQQIQQNGQLKAWMATFELAGWFQETSSMHWSVASESQYCQFKPNWELDQAFGTQSRYNNGDLELESQTINVMINNE